MPTPKMQMVGSRSAADLAFEAEGDGGAFVSGLQIYFLKNIFLPENISFIYILRVRKVGDACRQIYSKLDSYVEGAVKWELQKSWSVGRTVGPQ